MAKRGPERVVSDDRILLEILLASGPAVFASELEAELPLSRQQITNRLSGLEDGGFVMSKLASGRRVFWLTDEGHERVIRAARDQLT